MTTGEVQGDRLGCVADDYTGGTDVASALRRQGLRTLLLFGPPARTGRPPTPTPW
jgi:uncharacterized protein YgbK (DUF1537 family)